MTSLRREVPFTRTDMLLALCGEFNVRTALEDALKALDEDPGREVLHGASPVDAKKRLREATLGAILIPDYLHLAWSQAQMEEPTYQGIRLLCWTREFIKAYDDTNDMLKWENHMVLKTILPEAAE